MARWSLLSLWQALVSAHVFSFFVYLENHSVTTELRLYIRNDRKRKCTFTFPLPVYPPQRQREKMAIHGDVRERCSSFLSLEQFAFSLLEKWTGVGLREVNSKNRSSSVVPPHGSGSNSTSHPVHQGKRCKARATRSIAYSRWRNLGVARSSTSPPWTLCLHRFHSLLIGTRSHFCVRSWIFLLLQIRIGSVRWKRSFQIDHHFLFLFTGVMQVRRVGKNDNLLTVILVISYYYPTIRITLKNWSKQHRFNCLW